MFNIGVWEMTLILVAALLLLGPSKLPEFARWMGKAMREIRKATQEVKDAINFEIEREELNRIKHELETDIQGPMRDVQHSLGDLQNQVHQSLDPWQPPQETELIMGDPTCGGGEATEEAKAAKSDLSTPLEPTPVSHPSDKVDA
jgi:sec-independent protein translocase protein TatB